MKIAIGSDHAGFEYKKKLKESLTSQQHLVEDFGTYLEESCDYPDYAVKVAHAVADGNCSRGILICGTGIGMSIAANKVHGIRAALCCDTEAAKMSREHNNANVLCLGARRDDFSLIEEIVKVWLSTEFAGGRHERRVNKFTEIEKEEHL
ncbi:MAG: ribose 5-phosphate isomerase B [Planctomycetota bacterium]